MASDLHRAVGFNYRLNNVQAAIGAAQLEQLPKFLESRKLNHRRYAARLDQVPGLRLLGAPEETAPNYWFYSLLVDPGEFGMTRDALMLRLEQADIETRPLWPPNHTQGPYQGERAYGIERTQWFWERVLNLPCSSDLTESDVDRVAHAISAAGSVEADDG